MQSQMSEKASEVPVDESAIANFASLHSLLITEQR
jgi:hypothetical protein